MKHLILILMLLLSPAVLAQDESMIPDGTSSSDSNTSCDASVHGTIDDDPDSPGNDWCVADASNQSWTFTVTLANPTDTLDTSADAQAIEIYVRSYDEGQSGIPTIRVDIYDGTSCADLHETGTSTSLTDAGFPAKITELWTAAGISGSADICVLVVCTAIGGAPGARNSCDIDALEWDVTWGVAEEGRTRRSF